MGLVTYARWPENRTVQPSARSSHCSFLVLDARRSLHTTKAFSMICSSAAGFGAAGFAVRGVRSTGGFLACCAACSIAAASRAAARRWARSNSRCSLSWRRIAACLACSARSSVKSCQAGAKTSSHSYCAPNHWPGGRSVLVTMARVRSLRVLRTSQRGANSWPWTVCNCETGTVMVLSLAVFSPS